MAPAGEIFCCERANGRFGAIDSGEAAILPRSLHYVTRRIRTMRRKKPGHSGRDDRFFWSGLVPSIWVMLQCCQGPSAT
jgi:hypothetical protein